MNSCIYYHNPYLPFPHVVELIISDMTEGSEFPTICRETFVPMKKQFMMSHEYIWDDEKDAMMKKFILYLETEDMATWLKLTYG